MAPIDPHQLLKALSPLLGEDGNIKSPQEVNRVVGLMKDANKLVSRCVYINILKATKEQEVLEKFIEMGGWVVLNSWLIEAKGDNNSPVLTEILKVYQRLPVTIDLLKKDKTAKTIKSLSKSDDEMLKKLSGDIVDMWMQKIRQSTSESVSSSSEKSKKRHEKSKNHRDKEKLESPGKDAKTPDKTNKTKSDHKSDVKNGSNSSTQEKSNSEKPVSKDRPKSAVRTYATKFRPTGLEQEITLPQSKKKVASGDNKDKPAVKRSSAPNRTLQPPEKRPRPVLPGPISINSTPSNTSPPADAPGKIKLIPARPKPPEQHIIHESSGFMDAITAHPVVPVRKRKRQPSVGQKSPTSPPISKQPVVPSFYKDTLDTSEETEKVTSPTHENGETTENEDPTKESVKTEDIEMKSEENSEKNDESGDSTKDNASEVSSVSSTSDNHIPTKKKKRKKVSWVEEPNLKTIYYFELDETERVNVNRLKDFEEVKKHEMMMERQTMESAKRLAADKMVEKGMWMTPLPINDLPQRLVEVGANSTERMTQKEREQGVLQAIFFTKDMIPDTAGEPEPEQTDHVEPKIIPLEDESGTSADTSIQEYPAPVQENATAELPQMSLPPEVANMLASMAQQQKQDPSEPPSPGTVNANVQNLLQSLMQASGKSGANTEDQLTTKLKQMLEPFQSQLPESLQQMMPMGVPGVQGGPPPRFPPPGLLGLSPPGFPPLGPPRGPPRGPRPLGFQGDEWSENLRGGPGFRLRGPPPPLMRGRPPMRGRGGPIGPPRGRGKIGPRPVCKFLSQAGGCRYGPGCAFLHPGINGPPPM